MSAEPRSPLWDSSLYTQPVKKKSVYLGLLASLLLHIFSFYSVYAVSKKVFEILAKREKVFHFTLIKELPKEAAR
ncbi:MAG: hypothetical protein R3A80_13375 [Bdellovibrionota bacterium]